MKTTKEEALERISTLEQELNKLKKNVESIDTKDVSKLNTWELICEHIGRDPNKLPDVSEYETEIDKKQAIASFKLRIAAKVRRGTWVPDYSNSSQQKWYPYFQWKKVSSLRSGFVFYGSGTGGGHANTYVGGRLCFPTEQESDSFGKDFIELYNDYFTS